jgi:hypothetical protein
LLDTREYTKNIAPTTKINNRIPNTNINICQNVDPISAEKTLSQPTATISILFTKISSAVCTGLGQHKESNCSIVLIQFHNIFKGLPKIGVQSYSVLRVQTINSSFESKGLILFQELSSQSAETLLNQTNNIDIQIINLLIILFFII